MTGKLKFIAGRAGSGKTEYCLSAIADRLQEAPLGPACILLLPEHMTYQMERQLAQRAGEGRGFLRAYVFGFRRFARQVLLDAGGLLRPRITEVGRRLILRRILKDHGDTLSFFRRAAAQRGFSASLSDAIKELKSYGLTPEALEETAGTFDAKQEGLAGKLRDLAFLERSFQQAMQGRYDDAEDMMRLLIEKLPRSTFLCGAEIWVDGFIFFNPQERQVLTGLLQLGCTVHVTLPLAPDLKSRENLSETGLFHRSWRTMLQLRDEAKACGAEVTVSFRQAPADGGRFERPALAAIERRLFESPVLPAAVAPEGVILVEAANRRIEVEAVAADILRLARDHGYRFRDIGILVREEDAYDRLLKLVLEDRHIPFFIDGTRETVHHPLAELVRSAFEAVRGWRYEPVFRCLRTGFFPLTNEQVDRLENYVLEFGIRGAKRWSMAEPWHWYRRRSLDNAEEDLLPREQQALAEIDAFRRQAALPLLHFAAALQAGSTVRDYTVAIYALLEELAVPERLEQLTEQNEQEERLAAAAENRQIWADLLELLDQLVEADTGGKSSRRDYEAILGEGLDALEMSIIPPGLDYVTVASFDQNSLMNVKAIYIVGANEGVMPRRSREKGLFTDADRQHLTEAGLEIASGGLDGTLSEKFLLYRGFTEAREHLWISYALADAAGSGLAPSTYVGRLRRLLPDADFLSLPLESLELEETDDSGLSRYAELRLADGRKSVTGLAAALRGVRERGILSPYWRDVYNWAREQPELAAPLSLALAGLFAAPPEENVPATMALALFARKHRLRGSVTRFEEFAACPFRHFAHYGLRLEERREQGLHAFDFGTLLHSCLRSCGEQLKAAGRSWRDLSAEEGKSMVQSTLSALAPRLQNELLLSTKGYEHLLSRIGLTAQRSLLRLISMDQASKFHPVAFERAFGRGTGAMPPLTYELPRGVQLEISGQIDRIDFDEDGRYFLIVDYKTGEMGINLLEVYYGLKLQLLTYLLVARNLLQRSGDGERLPAGMLYCFLKYKWWETDQKATPEQIRQHFDKELKMPGWVLADPEVIRAIDGTGRFLRVRLGKNGDIYKSDRPKVKTQEEFSVLLSYVGIMLEKIGEQILAGAVAPQPYLLGDKTPCTYCPYGSLCGFDPQLSGCSYRRLNPLGDEDIIDTMEWMEEQGQKGVHEDS